MENSSQAFIRLLIIIIFVTLAGESVAQNLGFTYQAVAMDQSKAQGFGKDTQGEALANKDVALRFSLLEGSESGAVRYQETHETTTDIFGIFRLIIGRGLNDTNNTLEELDWGNTPYFLQIELDMGNGFELLGVEELLGSPYALNASKQFLSLTNNELSLSDANMVQLTDNDSTNELISNIELIDGELRITDAGGTKSVNLGILPVGEELVTDELQSLVLEGMQLRITQDPNLEMVDLSSFLDDTNLTETEVDAYVSNNGFLIEEIDGSTTNELQDISMSGSDLSISGGSSIDLSFLDTDTNLTETEVDAFVSNNEYLTTEVDGSVTNEIQDIILSGTNLSISNGSTIDLSGIDTNTDDQDLSLTGTTLGIEDGAGVDLLTLQDGTGTDDQTLSLLGNTLSIEDGNDVDLSGYQNTDTQDLSTDDTPGDINLTDGGNITINVNDADASASNELVTSFAINGANLELTDAGGTQQVLLSSLQGPGSDDQDLSLTGTTLNIEEGTGVDLSTLQDGTGTDDQALSLLGNTLSIEDGNTIDLSGYQNTDTQELSADGSVPGDISLTDGGNITINVNDADADAANEIQDLALDSDILTITRNTSATNINLSPYISPFSTTDNDTNPVTSNENGDYANDDFVFGSPQLDDDGNPNHDNRMFFDKSKGAFRAGNANTDQWDDDNVGSYSVALGLQNRAIGYSSVAIGGGAVARGSYSTALGAGPEAEEIGATAIGYQTVATGPFSTAIGRWATASGINSTAMGLRTNAPSYSETAIGRLNTIYTPLSADGWGSSDRLFVIGNGSTSEPPGGGSAVENRSDALVILKNGNTTLNGALTIDGDNMDGAGDPYTLPGQDGTLGQIITTNGSGAATWAAPVSQVQDLSLNTTTDILTITGNPAPTNIDLRPYNSPFSITGTTTSNENGDYANDDFVFGSPQMDDDGDEDHDNRMFFNKEKGAFRAGNADVGQWDDANVGEWSIGLGANNQASGFGSVSIGYSAEAVGVASVAIGNSRAEGLESITIGGSVAYGYRAISIGSQVRTFSRSEIGIGAFSTDYTPVDNTSWNPVERLFVIGNGISEATRSDALVMLKNGNTTLNGALTIDGDNAGGNEGYTLPEQDGTAGQIITTDGSGVATWAAPASQVQDLSLNTTTDILTITGNPTPTSIDLSPYISSFSTTGNVISNENGDYATDDFIFGSPQMDDDANAEHQNRMFFDKDNGAFRAGRTYSFGFPSSNANWDEIVRGQYSAAFGQNSRASGDYSFAFGDNTSASGIGAFSGGRSSSAMGNSSIALGFSNNALSSESVAIGRDLDAYSRGEIVLGNHNTSYVANSTTEHHPDDRLFVIGNGFALIPNRSDALIMLKNGNTTLHGQLTIDGDNSYGPGESYTLPAQDGADGQVLTTDGAGQTGWQEPAIPVGGIIMWSGAIADIPAGWALCDGSGSTPDLRGQFIVSYQAGSPDYGTVGATGGQHSQTLAADQLPAHQHEMDGASVSSEEHSHGVTVDASPTIVENVNATPGAQVLDGTGFGGGSPLFGSTDPDSHDHAISGNTGTGVGLVGNTIDNRPAYYTLAFIMKN